jgi:hypothetical protein
MCRVVASNFVMYVLCPFVVVRFNKMQYKLYASIDAEAGLPHFEKKSVRQ